MNIMREMRERLLILLLELTFIFRISLEISDFLEEV